MSLRRFVLSALALLACGSAGAQGLDGLFLQMKFAFGSLQEQHHFFLPDGRYMEGVPDGTLDAAGMDRAGAGAVSAASTFIFRPDGTFSGSSLGAVTTQQGVGKSESASGGTYKVSGNTLELNAGGTTKRLVAYAYDLGKGDVRLNIDGVFYKKR